MWSSKVMETDTKYPEEILMRYQLLELPELSKVSGIGGVRYPSVPPPKACV